jgi:hypothetical protein
MRFIRDHHRKVKRIALAADTKLASLAPRIAELFIQAEVKSFGYDEIEAAIAWAGKPGTRGTDPSRSASDRVPKYQTGSNPFPGPND